jgi:DAK2 domain fusion protein YloV
MLPVLKKAGVVDSGGRGLIVFLTGLYKGLTDDDSVDYSFEDSTQRDELGMPINEYANLEDLGDIQFGYCTEFMIIQIFPKTTLSDIDKLRERLCAIGDSVLCIGDLSLVKVHVHTNEPSKALGFALELGELFNVKIENMREQFRNLKGEGALAQKQELKPFGMVAVAPGEGISNVFTDLGIDSIISGGQTMNPSADDIATAVNKVPAETVFVFPNNKNIILAAEQAKGLTDKKIEVIPSRSVPEGIASALAFNPEGTFEDNKEAMNSALNTVKSGAVTYAVRSTKVDNFDLTEGEIIGLDNKTILSKGSDIKSATLDLIDKMINDDVVNITLFSGKDVKEDDSNLIVDALKQKYPDKEISLLQGGQPVYYYLISLE